MVILGVISSFASRKFMCARKCKLTEFWFVRNWKTDTFSMSAKCEQRHHQYSSTRPALCYRNRRRLKGDRGLIARLFVCQPYCWLYVLCISRPVLVSMRDLREALSAAILWSLPLRGRVVEVASKLLSLGFHTGDPIKIQLDEFLIMMFETYFCFATLSFCRIRSQSGVFPFF